MTATPLRRHGAERLEDGGRGFGIEARHGLVGQDQPGLLRQRARDRHALLLAAGELVGPRVGSVHEPHGVETGERDLAIGAGEAPQQHAPGGQGCKAAGQDILHGGEPPDQVELLEDERDVAPRHRGARARRCGRYRVRG